MICKIILEIIGVPIIGFAVEKQIEGAKNIRLSNIIQSYKNIQTLSRNGKVANRTKVFNLDFFDNYDKQPLLSSFLGNVGVYHYIPIYICWQVETR